MAETVGVYAGMLVAFENFSTFTVRPVINIHDLIVLKDYRSLGVGRSLMEAITAVWAKQTQGTTFPGNPLTYSIF
ncbi:GNAT family N-acetyltransferase [Viscerimonas tarda]